jgi:uncharacterized protein (TIGR03437 family)
MSPCSGAANGTWTCVLMREGGYAAEAVWNTQGTISYTPDTTYTQYRDLGGNAIPISAGASVNIGTKPILLERSPVTSVSAASYQGPLLASESITAAFGSDLATTDASASTNSLPTTLAGSTVKVKDSLGTERFAPLFFVDPNQVNYQVPTGTVTGNAVVTATSGDGRISIGQVQIVAVAPGLFSANANGQGIAAAVVLRVKGDGSQSYEPVAQFDQGQNKFVGVPIDLGPASDQVFLVLFGTGIRNRGSLQTVTAMLGGVSYPVLFAGPQGTFVGLDQINVLLPRALAGRGDVNVGLLVDGQQANTVSVNIK